MAIGGKEFVMNYDDNPPSFKLDLTIRSPNPSIADSVTIKNVLLDTGSDFTLLPIAAIRKLKLKPSGNVRDIIGFDEDETHSVSVKFYVAKVVVDGVEEVIMEVGAVEHPSIIGRDLINRWHILINAPNSTFEIATKKNYEAPV